jgi:hypothetical protein
MVCCCSSGSVAPGPLGYRERGRGRGIGRRGGRHAAVRGRGARRHPRRARGGAGRRLHRPRGERATLGVHRREGARDEPAHLARLRLLHRLLRERVPPLQPRGAPRGRHLRREDQLPVQDVLPDGLVVLPEELLRRQGVLDRVDEPVGACAVHLVGSSRSSMNPVGYRRIYEPLVISPRLSQSSSWKRFTELGTGIIVSGFKSISAVRPGPGWRASARGRGAAADRADRARHVQNAAPQASVTRDQPFTASAPSHTGARTPARAARGWRGSRRPESCDTAPRAVSL